MAEEITIKMPKALAEAFLKIESLENALSSAGRNDLALPDTPENRELYVRLQASNVRVAVEDWPKHPEYHEPYTHNGQIYFMDFTIFGEFLRKVREAVKT